MYYQDAAAYAYPHIKKYFYLSFKLKGAATEDISPVVLIKVF
jgi:hypothetical protein